MGGLGLALLLSGASACAAQDALALLSNARVRILLPDSLRAAPLSRPARVLIGTLVRATSDTLYLHLGTPDTVRIARLTVRQVAISRGASRMRSAIQFGMFAGSVSALVGNLLDSQSGRSRDRRALTYGGIGVGVGGAIGAISPFEHWRRLRR